MKNYIKISLALAIIVLSTSNCSWEYPIDKDGLLITERAECYVSNFELLDTDHRTVRSRSAIIDTIEQTIDVEVLWGTNLKSLWPQFSLVTDAKLDPKITDYVNFSDLENPKQWTVVSGNRQVRKDYTVIISVQQIP